MIKTLFIDFDGTLCHDKFWRSFDSGSLTKLEHRLFLSNIALVKDWMIGTYSSEQINKKLAEELHIDYQTLWDVFVKDCQTMKIENRVLEKIDELRNSYKVVLITDNMDCFDRFTVPALGLNKYFDLIINSFNECILKSENNGQLFLDVMRRVNSIPSESVLLDNSEKSCDIFKSLGGASCLVTTEKPLLAWLDSMS